MNQAQRFASLFILLCTPFLSGCPAVMLVGAIGGGEVVGEQAMDREERNGANLFKIAHWDKSTDRSTTTLNGKEQWSCASVNLEVVTERDDFHYVCIKKEIAKIDFGKNTNYECTDGRGGGVSFVINDKISSSLFCIKTHEGSKS